MKKEKNLLVILLALIAFTFTTVGYSSVVMAQDEDEEEFEDTENDDEEEDEDLEDAGNSGSDLFENEEGIEDEDGLYKLDGITAETFQKISNMERQNTLMKLKFEQGKLKYDLEKQANERKKLAANLVEEERNREIKREEAERKRRQERMKDEQEEEKQRQEREKLMKEEEAARKKAEQEAAISQELVDKIKSADLSNPDDIVALTQLMSLATGKQADFNGLGKSVPKEVSRSGKSWGVKKEEIPLEQKYEVKAIMGVAGKMVATIKYTEEEKTRTFKVKVGSVIEGWSVVDIKGSSVLLKRDNEIKVLSLN